MNIFALFVGFCDVSLLRGLSGESGHLGPRTEDFTLWLGFAPSNLLLYQGRFQKTALQAHPDKPLRAFTMRLSAAIHDRVLHKHGDLETELTVFGVPVAPSRPSFAEN